MSNRKANKLKKLINRIKVSYLDRYVSEVPWKWWVQQEELRIKLDIPKSFNSKDQLEKLMNENNSRCYKSEVAFDQKIQQFLKSNQYPDTAFRYKRNWPILNKYFGDFVFHRQKIIVELDGSIHGSLQSYKYDRRRDLQLTSAGWKVYRIEYPSMKGLEVVLSALADKKKIVDHERLQSETAKQAKAIFYKQDKWADANSMLIGCKIDRSIVSEVQRKLKHKERIKRNYTKYGISLTKIEP